MGTTTNYSWPYPAATDPVADGAQDIQDLASGADTTVRAVELATVMRFADASARTTALSGIEVEGMLTFLQDTDSLEYYDGSAWAAVGAAAGILQVVSTTKTDTWSASIAAGGSAAVTGLSATITPSSTSSKILVIAHLHGMDGRDSQTWVGMRVLRNGTAIGEATSAGSRSAVMGGSYNQTANGLNLANASGTHLDSPNSTSALTYAVHARRVSTHTATVYVNRTPTDTNSASFMRTASSITLMEVSA